MLTLKRAHTIRRDIMGEGQSDAAKKYAKKISHALLCRVA